MNRVVHFEIHAEDIERAKRFYGDVFGWEFMKWMDSYWGVMTAEKDSKEPGINGGLLSRPKDCAMPIDGAAVNAFVCTVQVDSYDEIHEKVLKAGGTVALPKAAIPGMAWQGYYKDLEGNIFGVHQPDKNAK